ncbi:hypothetical protein KAR91_07210 [Candidatus Pacearchaeota archaeon]|nr:hypothetical protein [Candidatus Pacearchaeota archaeon]
MEKEIVVDGRTYVLKEEVKTYKIGDKFKVKEGWGDAGDVYMLTEYGEDKVNIVKLENPSGCGIGVGETLLYHIFKVKDKQKITKEELKVGGVGAFLGIMN